MTLHASKAIAEVIFLRRQHLSQATILTNTTAVVRELERGLVGKSRSVETPERRSPRAKSSARGAKLLSPVHTYIHTYIHT